MRKAEIFKSLNEAQRREFDYDIEQIITEVISSCNLSSDKLHETSVNMR